MVWVRSSLEIFRQTVAGLSRGRIVWLLILLIAGMGALGLLLPERSWRRNHGPDVFGIISTMFYLQMVLPFSAMYFGVQAAHGDVEDRTVHYLFLRPAHRSSILIGKWLAVVALTGVVAMAAVGALFLGMAGPDRAWMGGIAPVPGELWWYGQAILLGAGAYGALAILFGAFFKRPMIWAVVSIVGSELMASNLPAEAGVRTLTVADPLRRFLLAGLEVESGSPLGQVLWPEYTSWAPEDMGSPVSTVLFFTGISLGLALWVYGRTEYDSRPRE